MKLGILQTGTSPGALKDRHGDYNDLFVRMLAGRGYSFDTYRVLDGILPTGPMAADGWLITGSKFSAYDDLPWIAPLEAFLRQCYDAEVPMVGICFGHQVLAQALGGKVERFEGGWSVGPTVYQTTTGEDEVMMAWHQDQVTTKPAEARVIATSPFCSNAGLAYGTRALTLQAHPEFTADFLADLLEARRDVLSEDVVSHAEDSLYTPLTSSRVADRIDRFFKAARL